MVVRFFVLSLGCAAAVVKITSILFSESPDRKRNALASSSESLLFSTGLSPPALNFSVFKASLKSDSNKF
jgi:hypothetical protein